MKLIVVTDRKGSEVKVISDNATAAIIKRTMQSIDWTTKHKVLLEKGSRQWIAVGGNIDDGGLAASFTDKSLNYYMDKAPSSIEHMTQILLSYYNEDGKFKNENNFTLSNDSSVWLTKIGDWIAPKFIGIEMVLSLLFAIGIIFRTTDNFPSDFIIFPTLPLLALLYFLMARTIPDDEYLGRFELFIYKMVMLSFIPASIGILFRSQNIEGYGSLLGAGSFSLIICLFLIFYSKSKNPQSKIFDARFITRIILITSIGLFLLFAPRKVLLKYNLINEVQTETGTENKPEDKSELVIPESEIEFTYKVSDNMPQVLEHVLNRIQDTTALWNDSNIQAVDRLFVGVHRRLLTFQKKDNGVLISGVFETSSHPDLEVKAINKSDSIIFIVTEIHTNDNTSHAHSMARFDIFWKTITQQDSKIDVEFRIQTVKTFNNMDSLNLYLKKSNSSL
jgi:hypothetical protein